MARWEQKERGSNDWIENLRFFGVKLFQTCQCTFYLPQNIGKCSLGYTFRNVALCCCHQEAAAEKSIHSPYSHSIAMCKSELGLQRGYPYIRIFHMIHVMKETHKIGAKGILNVTIIHHQVQLFFYYKNWNSACLCAGFHTGPFRNAKKKAELGKLFSRFLWQQQLSTRYLLPPCWSGGRRWEKKRQNKKKAKVKIRTVKNSLIAGTK